jgi:hypothetical protein
LCICMGKEHVLYMSYTCLIHSYINGMREEGCYVSAWGKNYMSYTCLIHSYIERGRMLCIWENYEVMVFYPGRTHKTNMLTILMHQMCISTTQVSSVMLRSKKLEIRKKKYM